MPVHRLPTGRAEIVSAYTDELDAWLLASERTRHPARVAGRNPASGPEGPRTRCPLWLARALGMVLGLLVTGTEWTRR